MDPSTSVPNLHIKNIDKLSDNSKESNPTVWCETCKVKVSASYYPKHLVGTTHIMEKNSIPVPQNLHIKPENVGYQMLVRAGWKYSKGLGAQEQGRRIPIIPKIKKDRLGIGAKPKPTRNSTPAPKLGKKKVVVQESKDRQKRLEIMRYMGT